MSPISLPSNKVRELSERDTKESTIDTMKERVHSSAYSMKELPHSPLQRDKSTGALHLLEQSPRMGSNMEPSPRNKRLVKGKITLRTIYSASSN
jgi:hypothetical protein